MSVDIINGYRLLSLVTFFSVVSVVRGQTVEQRLTDLELRISRLEAKVGIGQAATAVQPSQESHAQSYSQPASYNTAAPVILKLINKKFASGEGDEPDGLQFHIQFKNTGSKDITGIEGDMLVKNLGAKQLMDFGMSMSKYIAAGDSLLWPCEVEYESSDDGHKSVYQSDKSYLIVELMPEKIDYSDGTSDVFKKK
jgi:hypothetical protein